MTSTIVTTSDGDAIVQPSIILDRIEARACSKVKRQPARSPQAASHASSRSGSLSGQTSVGRKLSGTMLASWLPGNSQVVRREKHERT